MTENFFCFLCRKKKQKQSKNPQQIENKYFSIVFCGCFWVWVLCKVLFLGFYSFSSAFWILSTFKDIYYWLCFLSPKMFLSYRSYRGVYTWSKVGWMTIFSNLIYIKMPIINKKNHIMYYKNKYFVFWFWIFLIFLWIVLQLLLTRTCFIITYNQKNIITIRLLFLFYIESLQM